MADLFLEVFCEEIPARMQSAALKQLAEGVTNALSAANLRYDHVESYVTPRRLAVYVTTIPEQQPDMDIEKKGPKVDAPEKAIQGFLGSIGKTLEDCEQRELPKGTFWYYVATQKGRPTAAVLEEILPTVLDGISWPKSMRWGSGSVRWVRPLHSLVCLFGGEVVPFAWHGISAGRTTKGHRVLGGGQTIQVTNFDQYKQALRTAGVIVDHTERRQIIQEGCLVLAKDAGLSIVDDPALLDEVTGLVEWPVPLMGAIDDAFMSVPSEVLTASIRTNQKYFTLQDATGAMAPKFIVVANIMAEDDGASIVAGNERVLRARLSDAKFFWDNDNRKPLESFTPALDSMVFHAKLGTIAAKVERITALASSLANSIPSCDPSLAGRAATLAKADLTTEMVFEFPEVQGLMGQYYAQKDGEDARVSKAIADHYSPLGPNDACPTEPVSVAVALADKLDTLTGFWAIDEKPTGSRDPYALRRAALGVIRLLVENGIRLPLKQALSQALSAYSIDFEGDKKTVIEDLMGFFADRLKVHLKEQGVRHDLIASVFALGSEDDLVRLLNRVSALQSFLSTEDGTNLLAAYKRAVNILNIEEKKEAQTYKGTVDQSALVDAAEKALVNALSAADQHSGPMLAAEDFTGAMAVFADLRQPVDTFFEDVTVNDSNASVRHNRLMILANIRDVLGVVADFSLIESS